MALSATLTMSLIGKREKPAYSAHALGPVTFRTCFILLRILRQLAPPMLWWTFLIVVDHTRYDPAWINDLLTKRARRWAKSLYSNARPEILLLGGLRVKAHGVGHACSRMTHGHRTITVRVSHCGSRWLESGSDYRSTMRQLYPSFPILWFWGVWDYLLGFWVVVSCLLLCREHGICFDLLFCSRQVGRD